jgi:photosystem II stability/assembly factor-like uncharacterized protein
MDFLEAVEQQLVAATERGISRRRWRWPWLMRIRVPLRAPSVGIAAGVGAALAASAIAATITIPSSRSKAHPATLRFAGVRSYTAPGAVPIGFQPRSFTAISEFSWWLLGTAPCGSRSCTTIVRTTDGGPRFTRIAAPPTSGVSEVRFADSSNGYALGPQLWSTHDGGRTWSRQHLGTTVGDLAIADGYVYALAYGHGQSQLMRSVVGADRWATLSDVGDGYLSSLWVQGTTVIVQSGSHLLVSADQGIQFQRRRGVRRAGDCGYDGGPGALWALCSTGMAPDDIELSRDLGNHFTAAAQVPNGPIGAFAAASGSTAVASGQGPLYRTTNSGASWRRVRAPAGDWTYLGFTDATHGVAIGQFGTGSRQDYRLYYTIDAGASYHFVPIG